MEVFENKCSAGISTLVESKVCDACLHSGDTGCTESVVIASRGVGRRMYKASI